MRKRRCKGKYQINHMVVFPHEAIDIYQTNVPKILNILGLRQGDLANACGISRPMINFYLNDHNYKLKPLPCIGTLSMLDIMINDEDFDLGPQSRHDAICLLLEIFLVWKPYILECAK